MRGFDAVPSLRETLLHLFRNEDRTMLAASTAERDCKIALPFLNVVRQKELEQVRSLIEELLRLRKLPDVLRDFWMAAGELAELGNEVRIGEKAHIEHKVRIRRNAILETKADGRDGEITVALAAFAALELRVDMGTELVNVESRSVEQDVGDVANRIEALALGRVSI